MAELTTICIPTYNQAEYIGETIESVLGQTYPRFRLIIVDNASTDNTEEIVQSFPDQRLEYIRNASNLGMTRNFNRCLELTQTKYMTLLSSDDKYHPTFLERCVQLVEMYPDLSFVHTGAFFIDGTGQLQGRSAPPGAEIQDGNKLFYEYWTRRKMRIPVYFLSMFYRRNSLAQVGGFSIELPYFADTWAWLLMAVDSRVGYIPEPLTYYRVYGNSTMGKKMISAELMDERKKLAELVLQHPRVKEHPDFIKLNRGKPARVVYVSVSNLRIARRNGQSVRQVLKYYRQELVQYNWRVAFRPWCLFQLILAVLPPGLLALIRKIRLRRIQAA